MLCNRPMENAFPSMFQTFTRAVCALLASAAVLSCGNGGSGDASASSSGGGGVIGDNPRVELGGGQARFVTLVDGQDMELTLGPQGGWHMEVTSRVCDINARGMLLSYEAYRVGSTTKLSFDGQFMLDPARLVRDGSCMAKLGDRAILDIPAPSDVVGQMLLLKVIGLPADGSGPFEDSRTVRVIDEIP